MPLLVVFFFFLSFLEKFNYADGKLYYLTIFFFRVGKTGYKRKEIIIFNWWLTYAHNVNRVDSPCSVWIYLFFIVFCNMGSSGNENWSSVLTVGLSVVWANGMVVLIIQNNRLSKKVNFTLKCILYFHLNTSVWSVHFLAFLLMRNSSPLFCLYTIYTFSLFTWRLPPAQPSQILIITCLNAHSLKTQGHNLSLWFFKYASSQNHPAPSQRLVFGQWAGSL